MDQREEGAESTVQMLRAGCASEVVRTKDAKVSFSSRVTEFRPTFNWNFHRLQLLLLTCAFGSVAGGNPSSSTLPVDFVQAIRQARLLTAATRTAVEATDAQLSSLLELFASPREQAQRAHHATTHADAGDGHGRWSSASSHVKQFRFMANDVAASPVCGDLVLSCTPAAPSASSCAKEVINGTAVL